MPLYEYQCEACGERFEVIQKFSDPPPDACEKCGKGPVHRQQSSPAIQFKGSGWYITDYAQKGKSGGDKTGGESGASSKNSGGTASGDSSSSGESKSSEPKSSDSKSSDSKSSESKNRDSSPSSTTASSTSTPAKN
jgi:putative FmdB family regulatory protein